MLAFRAHGSIRTIAPLALIATLALAACGGGSGGTSGGSSTGNARYSGTINIASSTWTGYAVIYLANSRGTWKASAKESPRIAILNVSGGFAMECSRSRKPWLLIFT